MKAISSENYTCALVWIILIHGTCANNLCNEELVGGRWRKYLYNGPGQCKNVLRYGVNTHGYGYHSADMGCYKMSESEFDAMKYTELLALGDEGEWVKINKIAHGEPFKAKEVFAVSITKNLVITRGDTGETRSYVNPTIRKSGHVTGPLYQDLFGGINWMWTDHYGVDSTFHKGRVLGAGTGLDLMYSWTWYARNNHSVCGEPWSSAPTPRPTAYPTATHKHQSSSSHHRVLVIVGSVIGSLLLLIGALLAVNTYVNCKRIDVHA